ncbi:MAG: endonuclease/exonuclease/phosphatase family protein [Shinella sp.]|nr:endonuclease/exonuclease/phosphatase family protein [Shinella sp.]
MVRPIRILTYNVHSCFGTDRKLDPSRIAEVIAACEPDVIALQEIDVERARSGGMDQAHMIASHLRMTAHFHPALHLEDEKYGDAILTALPTRLVKAGPLPSVGEPRGALWVEVDLGEVKLQMFVTHLGLFGAERVRQTEALLGPSWLGGSIPAGSRVVLAGDLNSVRRSPAYRMLTRVLRDTQLEPGMQPKPTFPSRLPLLRLDHILAGEGLRVLETKVHADKLARLASDHLPLSAVLEILPLDDDAPAIRK